MYGFKKVLSLIIVALFMFNSAIAHAETFVITDKSYNESVFEITLDADEASDVFVYHVSYDEEGNFSGVGLLEKNLVVGSNPVVLQNVNENDRIFLWNSELSPYTEAIKPYDGIIHLNGTSISASGVENITIDGTILTINAAGTYQIEGELLEGQICVCDTLTKEDNVELIFDNVSVSNSTTAPFNGAGAKITISMTDNSVNTFTDNSTAKYTGYTSTDAPKGAFYSKRDLDISGSGTLVVDANYKNGLVCGADIDVKKGASLDVTAVNNAIKADNSVSFTKKTGTVKVYSAEGDGIKTDAIDSDTGLMESDKGFISIKGGSFEIEAVEGDGIQVDNYIELTGGTIDITSGKEGIKADGLNIPLSVDDVATGEYGNGTITISGGSVTINSGEDGIKATENIDISGGTIDVTANGTDGYDAIQVGESEETVTEGDTTVTEKTVIVEGAINVSGGEITLSASDDCLTSNSTISISGGKIEGLAGSDFIKTYTLFKMTDGELNIEAVGDGIQSGDNLTEEVSASETVKSNYTEGNIEISGGVINIETNGGHTTTLSDDANSCKGIKGITEVVVSGGTFNIDSADDALHSNYNLTITGGELYLASGDDGVHADYILTLGTENGGDDDYMIDVSYSYEGLEGSVINILSGTQYVYSTDDGVNAAGDYDEEGNLYDSSSNSSGSSTGGNGFSPGGGWGGGPSGGAADDTSPYGMLYIKGGKTYVEAYGDGLDSNGDVEMSGGIAVVNGPTNGGNGVFDTGDSSSFNVTGGTLIGAGTSSMTVNINASVGSLKKTVNSTQYAGNAISITTDNDSLIFIPKVNWNYLYVASSNMTKGSAYTYSTISDYTGTKILGKTVNDIFYGLLVAE